MSRACSMCHGTDVQHTCEQGQCYWEHCQQREERDRQDREEYERYIDEWKDSP